MVNIYDVSQDALVQQVAIDLEKDGKVKIPDWALFVKTGNNKERPPQQDNWWFLRAASILKKVAVHGPVGVAKLRTKYGSKKNRGVRPEKFVKSGGKIIRVILQQLEAAGYVVNEQKTKFKGRVIAPAGKSLLDKSAGVIFVKPKESVKAQKTKVASATKQKEAKVAESKEEVKEAEIKKSESKEDKKPEVKVEEDKTEDAKVE